MPAPFLVRSSTGSKGTRQIHLVHGQSGVAFLILDEDLFKGMFCSDDVHEVNGGEIWNLYAERIKPPVPERNKRKETS